MVRKFEFRFSPAGENRRIIVVGMGCSHQDLQRVHEYCPYHIHSGIYGDVNGRGDATVAWIVHELKPCIDRSYRYFHDMSSVQIVPPPCPI